MLLAMEGTSTAAKESTYILILKAVLIAVKNAAPMSQ